MWLQGFKGPDKTLFVISRGAKKRKSVLAGLEDVEMDPRELLPRFPPLPELQNKFLRQRPYFRHSCGIINDLEFFTVLFREVCRDIWKLRCVVLDGMHVGYPPLPGCPPFKFCTELNLYNNLISTWSDLLDILSFFPSLLYLNLRFVILLRISESVSFLAKFARCSTVGRRLLWHASFFGD